MQIGSNMTAARLEEIEALFHAALEQDAERLGGFLEERCAGDDMLRCEVEALLAAHREAANFIAAPVARLDPGLFDDEATDPLIGQKIGHYQIAERIGSGGMGVVYLARRADQQYERLVAIKLIKRGMDSEAVLRHFRNERQILAGLEHPNIARLLDGDTTESGLPYFAMEYVDGVPIDEYCDRESLSVTARLQLFREICAAVSYAHRRAVIHRDIKPSNILVDAEGVPKLLDFGIARILHPAGGEQSVATLIGLRVMTPEYASPEQVRGEPATTISDVYSLGVVLFRLLTGRLPYRVIAGSHDEIARTIERTDVQRPSAVIDIPDGDAGREDAAAEGARRLPEGDVERLRRRLRGDLDNIVLMALRKEPERRYQSVEHFAEDIRRHLEMLPVRARRDTLVYRALKFVRRNTAATVAATLVVLTLLGGIVATSLQAQRAEAEKARAERRFNDVRQLARAVLFDYHDAIRDLPGATAVRERLVKDGLAYLDSLAVEASGDPALQRELADAYERVGDVRGQMYGASLGDVAGALDSYLKALEIREALIAAQPQDVQGRRDLARSYGRIGNRLLQTSEAARGTDYLQRSLDIYLHLAAELPSEAAIRHELAAAYNDLGLALEDWGDLPGALAHHREALALRDQLAAADPTNDVYRRGLAVTYMNRSRALALSGDLQSGLDSNRNALTLNAALFAKHPTNADFRRLLAVSYQNDGDYRARLGDIQGALESFRSKLDLDEQAFADDPVNVLSREDLGYTCERIGALLAESARPAEALSYYRRALALYEDVMIHSPENLVLRYHAIIAGASIGRLQVQLGERAAAVADVSAVIARLDEIPQNPTNSAQAGLRAEVYVLIGGVYAALARSDQTARNEQDDHWRISCDMYSRGLAIWQDMQRLGLLTGHDAAKSEEVAHQVAECDSSLAGPRS